MNAPQTISPAEVDGFTLRDLPASVHRGGKGMLCPVCKFRTRTLSGRTVTELFRYLWITCQNPCCNFGFVASMVFEHGLTPSALPDARQDLKMKAMPHNTAALRPGAKGDTDQVNIFDFLGDDPPAPPG